jgi:hypothetical protein
MDQDDDVERLFSWLQTPDIRYREFAGAREVSDAVGTWQIRTNTVEAETPAPRNVQLAEEYPANQFPDQSQVRVEVEPAAPTPATISPASAPMRREPAMIAPAPVPPSETAEGGVFALGASGRGGPRYVENVVPAVPPPTRVAPPPEPTPPPPSAPVPAASGLLGGAYGENVPEAASPMPAAAPERPGEPPARSLDSVFNRLAGGRGSASDPRERMRHIPGLGPTNGRPR